MEKKWNKIMVGHKMGTKKEEGGFGGKGTKGFRARSREVPLLPIGRSGM